MGLFKNFVSQTRKPDGFLGKMMLSSMNSGHAMYCIMDPEGYVKDIEKIIRMG